MLIGIDASRANRTQKTGVESYAYFLIQELKKTLDLSSRRRLDSEHEFILYTDKSLEGDLAILPVNWTQKVLRWFPGRLWTQVRLSWEMLVNPPDVLFIPAHVFPIIHPKKTVMTVHDIAALKFPETYNWFERWYSVWSARVALKSLWKIITPSEFTKFELGSWKLDAGNEKFVDKISVVPLAYNSAKYRKISYTIEIETVLKKYYIKTPFLLSIGRLEEKKNIVRIIKAFDNLKSHLPFTNYQLLLVGKSGYGFEKVEQAINKSPYKKDIITPGWVDEDDMPYLMNAAEVFVFPSLYEGFGIPILEAMACGTPVVASGGNPSASLRTASQELGGAACVYVDPLDEIEIKTKIEELLGNDMLREEKIRLGLERVKDFSWEKCARETFELLV